MGPGAQREASGAERQEGEPQLSTHYFEKPCLSSAPAQQPGHAPILPTPLLASPLPASLHPGTGTTSYSSFKDLHSGGI